MTTLFRLIVAHLIGDFLLQKQSWVEEKKHKRLRSGFFYIHGLIHGLLAYLLLADWNNWLVPLLITISHLAIDYWKSGRTENTVNFIIDQLLHLIIILIAWLIFTGDINFLGKIITYFFNKKNVWVLLTGYLIAVWPMRFIIALATQRWRKEINNDGLLDAGKWIGQIERILILTFVIVNKFEAIGFLITAKSIFRFNEINKERKEAEYILIGTLLSFALSIIWGLFISFLLKVSV